MLQSTADVPRAATDVAGILNPQFVISNLGPAASASEGRYEASDNETAAAAQVAREYKAPFVAFRAISDGSPDPLMLPGYPWQFLAYYQLAADNAALAAEALVKAMPPGM